MTPINNPKERKIPLRIKRFTYQVNRALNGSRPLFANSIGNGSGTGEGDRFFAKRATIEPVGALGELASFFREFP